MTTGPSTLEECLDNDVQKNDPAENLQLGVQPVVHVSNVVNETLEPSGNNPCWLDVRRWRACWTISAQLVSFSGEGCIRGRLAG